MIGLLSVVCRAMLDESKTLKLTMYEKILKPQIGWHRSMGIFIPVMMCN